jgi:hypothetical protein
MLASVAFFTAFAMVIVNFLYMVAGNIPEYEGCVFLNGNSGSFLLFFPLAAFIVSSIHTHFAIRNNPDKKDMILRSMRQGALTGAAIYFVIGSCCAGESFIAYSGDLCVLMTIYTLLMMVFAQFGSMFAIQKAMRLKIY